MKRLYSEIIAGHFQELRKMLFLMGPRQVGKTTTSREMGQRRTRSVYLNWDNLDHQKLVLEGPARLASQVGADILQQEKPLLILDEIHKSALAHLFEGSLRHLLGLHGHPGDGQCAAERLSYQRRQHDGPLLRLPDASPHGS